MAEAADSAIPTQRTVYGRDRVVTYTESSDTVSVRYIHSHQGDKGRFSPQCLLETLGFNEETATIQFVMNNNLHKDGKGCRGAVLLVNLCIGMIVQSVGSFILFHVLCPRRLSGFKIIDLRIKDRYYGFYLQQIRGPCVGVPSTHRHGPTNNIDTTGVHNYPYCVPYIIDGRVYMDPAGPDFCVPVVMDTVKESNEIIANEFTALVNNLCSRSDTKTRIRTRNLRKSNKANVLYVVDSRARVDMGNNADMFYVPAGAPVPGAKCPWKRTNGQSDEM